MSNEIVINYPSGFTIYALVLNGTGQIWNGSSFETPDAANWGDYDIPLAEASTTGLYRGDFPSVAAGAYGLVFKLQGGGAPATTDVQIGGSGVEWGDSAILPRSTLATAAALATVDGNVDSVLEDTGTTLPATLATLATAAALATVDGNVDSILADTGTDGVVVATASKTGYALSAAGVDAILDEVVDDSYTLRQLLRGFASALFALVSGGGTTTITFRDLADTKNRIVATVDTDGNRSAITLVLD